MAFSDLCNINNNVYKTVENEDDQSDHIMEESSMVRYLITTILDDSGPADEKITPCPDNGSINTVPNVQNQYKNGGNTPFVPPSNFNTFPDPSLFNFTPDQNGINYQNGFANGITYDNELFGVDTLDSQDAVTPEQLNLLRLAAQEIGGAQFTPNTKYDEKYFNYLDQNQRSSLQEPLYNEFRQNNLNIEPMSLNNNLLEGQYNTNIQRHPFEVNQRPHDSPNELLTYLNQFGINERNAEVMAPNPMPEYHSNYQSEEERRKMFANFNPNYQQPAKPFNENPYLGDMFKQMGTTNPGFEYQHNGPNPMNFKTNGFNQENFTRRDMAQMMPREGFQAPHTDQRFDSQMPTVHQQELARQVSLFMRNRHNPRNPLNIDVNFMHENPQFNLAMGALLGPSPPIHQSVLPSPLLDIPLLAPYHAMRNVSRQQQSSSGILHLRLDVCYEQWSQLERERKRTEARLALAFPGRAVSSSNSLPVPRLPPCPTRVDRLAVDMLREHTKVITLMCKMEALRSTVCVSHPKKATKDDPKITVLKRGQENSVQDKEAHPEVNFDPSSWKEDIRRLAEIDSHSEIEGAMLAWRDAVANVQAARRREMAQVQNDRYQRPDLTLLLADAVKQLSICARRARLAMWCDLTLTVAMAPSHVDPVTPEHNNHVNNTKQVLSNAHGHGSKQNSNEKNNQKVNTSKSTNDTKEDKTTNQNKQEASKSEKNKSEKADTQKNEGTSNRQRRQANYRKTQGNYYKNRYDGRFAQRLPYHYLATGPIN